MNAEEQVLRTFARHDATTLEATLLAEESDAVDALEREHALLRYRWDGTEWITLTLRGLARRGGGEPASPAGPRIVHEHPHPLHHGGAELNAYILGCPRGDGTWSGWIEFAPVGNATRRLRTPQETSQPSLDALVYWASGLEDVYFDGALARAAESG